MLDTVLVIPCYNEAARLPGEAYRRFADGHPHARLLFVDDGSRDGTLARLHTLCAVLDGAGSVLALPANAGKAEAVRQGCLAAFKLEPRCVGYWDADLSIPLDTVDDFRAVLASRPAVELVSAARVPLVGRSLQRGAARHLLGRVFATAASLTLGLGVYDTQCGAKLFRVTPAMRLAFARPFLTRWLFDIEILARLTRGGRLAGLPPMAERLYEAALKQCHDVPGSKVRALDFPRAIWQLAHIYRVYLAPNTRDPDAAAWQALANRPLDAPARAA